jgi:hypothetical protein
MFLNYFLMISILINMIETIIIIILISIILIFSSIHKSEVIFVESFTDNNSYLVRNLPDKQKASNNLGKIRDYLRKTINFIINKINIVENKEETEMMNEDYKYLEMSEYIKKIDSLFDNIIFSETSADSTFTSYSINKGEEIVFCLRSKEDNLLHDINLVMYVAIHEVAHVGCPEIGHTPLFHKINKFMLKEAIKIKAYKYEDYETRPINYCGMNLSSTILN